MLWSDSWHNTQKNVKEERIKEEHKSLKMLQEITTETKMRLLHDRGKAAITLKKEKNH